MEDDNRYFELEPAALSDNTEVKVPLTPSEPQSGTLSLNVSPVVFTPNRPISQISKIDVSIYPGADLVEYHRLLKLFRELPADMFVDRLLLDYNQSESDIEQARMMLYELVRESDDFPFDVDSDPKRRVNTRQGESAAVKLSRDVHTLLSVVEGADTSCMKDMISSSKRSGRPSSISSLGKRATSLAPDKCNCQAEVKQLKDLITGIQADMLLMKQRQAATENLRNSEIKILNSSVEKITTSVANIDKDIADKLNAVNQCIKNFEQSPSTDKQSYTSEFININNNIKSLNNDVHELKQIVECLQGSQLRLQASVLNDYSNATSRGPVSGDIGHNPVSLPNDPIPIRPETPEAAMPPDTSHMTITNIHSRPGQPDKHAPHSRNDDTHARESVNPAATITQPMTAANTRPPVVNDRGSHEGAQTEPQTHMYQAIPIINVLDNNVNTEDIASFGNTTIPTLVTHRDDRNGTTGNRYSARRKKPQRKQNINFGIIHRELTASNENRNFQSSYNADIAESPNEMSTNPDDEDYNFDQYVRRHPKRFYIGGFQPTITETKLANYIRRRGPKVTKVSISRKRRFGNVVIQVNVEDDENANAMTDDPYFWPRGVICRPWVPYNSYRARQKETVESGQYGTEPEPRFRTEDWGYNGHYDDNPYLALDADIAAP